MSRLAVRTESVVIRAVDEFSTRVAKMAAAALVLDKALDGLDGTTVSMRRDLAASTRDVDVFGTSVKRNTADINQLTGRLTLLGRTVATIGPGLVPIAAVGVPAVAGLASQFGFAAIGAGSLVVAAQGVGTALEAVNKAALEPTAANLEAARAAMQQIGPEAQEFVKEFQAIRPVLNDIRDSAAAGWFPGLTESLEHLVEIGPQVGDIFEAIGKAGGDLIAGGAESFASPRWAEFLEFVEREAPAALTSLGHVVGDVAHGLAELWMAFTPVNNGVAGWLEDVASGFDRWASGLAETQGFAEFVTYVNEVGPQVADTFTALANAVLQIAEAAAPLGGPVLAGIEALANVIAGIADSDLGTPIMAAVAAMSAFRLATFAWSKVSSTAFGQVLVGQRQVSTGFVTAGAAARRFGTDLSNVARYGTLATESSARLRSQLVTAGKSAALVGGLTIAMTGAADSFGLTNTASLALAGTLGGPVGVAVGTSIGAFLDMKAATEDLANQLDVMRVASESNDLKTMRTALADFESQLSETSEQTGFFDTIGDSFDALGLDTAEASRLMNELRYNIGVLEDDMHRVGGEKALRNLLDPTKQLREGFEGVADAAGLMADAVRNATSFMTRQASFDNWRASIQAARDALKENGATLDAFTAKGRENRAALREMGAAALDWAAHLKGADRQDFLANARQSIIRMAEDFGATDREARKLANGMELLGGKKVTPKFGADDSELTRKQATAQRRIALLNALKANPDLDLNDKAFLRAFGITKGDLEWLDRFKANPVAALKDLASSGIKGVAALLRGLDGDTATTYIDVVRRNFGTSPVGDSGNPYRTPADGETVPGPRFPYRDSVPALLAPTEEVISNRYGQADRWRPLLKAINANRLADGGTVGTYARSVQSFANGGTVKGHSGGVPVLELLNDPDSVRRMRRETEGVVDVLAMLRREMLRDLKDRLKDAERFHKAAERNAEAAKELRNSIRDASRSLRDSVRDQFSGSDLFGAEGASFDSILAGLKEQAGQATQFGQLTFQLKRLGLDGAALQALLETGNVDLLKQFAAQGTQGLGLFESQFNATQLKAQGAGQAAAFTVMGERLASAEAHLAKMNAREDRAEARVKRYEEATKRLQERIAEATEDMSDAPARSQRKRAAR